MCIRDSVYIPLDQAIPCGLMVNELVSNALKYAYKGTGERGVITLRVEETDGFVEIEVSDKGVGLPKDFDYTKVDSLGIYLVQALTEQLGAEIKVESTKEGRKGTLFLIRFEKQNR